MNRPHQTTSVLDLGPAADDVRALVPVPQEALPAKLGRFNSAPEHQWPVHDSRGDLVGYLCVFTYHSDPDAVFLAVYGENPIGRRDWRFKPAQALANAVVEHRLKGHPTATLVLAPEGTPRPNLTLGDGKNPIIPLPIAIAFSQPTESGGSFLARASRATAPTDAPPVAAGAASQPSVALPAYASAGARLPNRAPVAPAANAKGQPGPPAQLDPKPADLATASTPFVCAADLRSTATEWLWHGRIPLGQTTLLAGDPGVSKSLLTAYLAAVVSTGGPLSGNDVPSPKGTVLMVSPEDDAESTIRPRLEAAGADIQAVHIWREPVDLVRDFERFEQAVTVLKDVRLITIDPITACMGSADPNRTAPARTVMMHLSRLAYRVGCAMVIVLHLTKSRGSKSPPAAVSGSNAFAAAARAAHLVTVDSHDPDGRLLLPFKNNLGPVGTGLAFRIATAHGRGGAPHVVVDGEPVTVSAADALRASSIPAEVSSALEDAKAFLVSLLGHRPCSAKVIYQEARAAGIARATLLRAKDSLGIRPRKVGMAEGWMWALSTGSKMIKPSEDAQSESLSTFAFDEHLQGGAAKTED